MNRIKIITLTLFIAFSTLLNSCTSENDNENITVAESKTFDSYVSESLELKDITEKVVLDAKNLGLSSKTEIESYIIKNVSENASNKIAYVDLDFYNHNNSTQKTSVSELKIQDLGLSSKTVEYFNKLEALDKSQDFEGMVTLLEEYKIEYSLDSDLESLAGVFATIEIFKDDLTNNVGISAKNCKIDPETTGGAALSGAISGAIWGFKLGSWLGPAGTAAGTVGGAIVGAVVSTIVSIGVQGVKCELNKD